MVIHNKGSLITNILFLSLLIGFSNHSQGNERITIEQQFEILYSRIDYECIKSPNPSSSLRDYIDCEPYKEIVNLGPKVVPFLVEKLKITKGLKNSILESAIRTLTKKKFQVDFTQNPFENQNPYINWWENGRSDSKQEFEEIYRSWSKLPESRKKSHPYTFDWDKQFKVPKNASKEDSRKIRKEKYDAIQKWKNMPEGPEKERMRPYNRTIYQRILDFGVAALPHAIEKIKQGDTDLIGAVNYWTDDALAKAAQEANVSQEEMAEFVPQWWEKNKENWLLPPVEHQNEE